MIEELKFLGLNHSEAKALDVLLKERISLRELSKNAGIPFGKVYSVIKGLKEKNIIKETNSRPKLIYIENASEILTKLIKEKQKKERDILESLREKISKIDHESKKETKFFEIGVSKEQKRNIQLRAFNEAEVEVLQILNIHHKPNLNRKHKTIYEKTIEKAVKKGITFKAIYPRSLDLPLILNKLNKKYPKAFQVKRFDTDFVRCDIIDERATLIKLTQEDIISSGGSIFIENERLAENLKEIFEQFWEQAE